MSKGTKILIFLAIIFVIIVVIIWLVFFRGQAVPPEINLPANTNTSVQAGTGITGGTETIVNAPPVVAAAAGSDAAILSGNLVRIASTFTERFGSFSNQEANYKNIKDLQIFMTDSMKAWSDQFIAESKLNQEDNSIYFGVTTKALSSQVLSLDEDAGAAEILIKTQRREAIGNTANFDVYYQEMKILMKKVGADMWKVDGSYWQERS